LYRGISGTPPFDVTWYKDRRQIRSSKKYKVTAKNYHTSIRILNVEAADVGEYQCKAQNDVGSDTCFCTVKLKGKVLAHICVGIVVKKKKYRPLHYDGIQLTVFTVTSSAHACLEEDR
uniref:Ig-like domain-containing protein n=1 Tax=Anser cygnoides TaxID=8845 RepID=A0A8B9E3G5_ANSCY